MAGYLFWGWLENALKTVFFELSFWTLANHLSEHDFWRNSAAYRIKRIDRAWDKGVTNLCRLREKASDLLAGTTARCTGTRTRAESTFYKTSEKSFPILRDPMRWSSAPKANFESAKFSPWILPNVEHCARHLSSLLFTSFINKLNWTRSNYRQPASLWFKVLRMWRAFARTAIRLVAGNTSRVLARGLHGHWSWNLTHNWQSCVSDQSLISNRVQNLCDSNFKTHENWQYVWQYQNFFFARRGTSRRL